MRKIAFLIVFISLWLSSYAQEGTIGKEQMREIKKSYNANDPATKALTNALSNNDVMKLVLSRENLSTVDHNFTYRVNAKGITDQKSSGRCWMFTGMNVLRPSIIEKYQLSNFDFSHNYLYFWDIFEKCNLFLEAQIKYANLPMDDKSVDHLFRSTIGDGGVWNSFSNLAEKYGLVPEQVMPETNTSNNTHWMLKLIKRKLREDGLEIRNIATSKTSKNAIQNAKIKMLGDIYRILCLNLGEPPAEFDYRFVDKNGKLGEYKTYTPISFMKEVLGDYDFSNYVMLMNDPSRPYFKMYEIDYDRNVMEGKNWIYLNLPSDDIKKFAIESIKNNEAMYASCDVNKQINKDLGYSDIYNYDFESLYGVEFGMNKAQRIKTYDSGSTHAMTLIAVDLKDDKPVKWQFENSWGASAGHNGYLTFTDKWFDEYMFRVVINKKYIDAKTLEYLNQKPIVLPPWDPMFREDY
ncbi:bleomycin hydrolase [Balneicella halophila]|uniref:Aminopeptidase n=1 Tax=Balneicella halophila TaxID=1537566 RepID=A0A7L4UNA1_BALHA|nr:C1 family peptidase [Balneicella halophila]PVX50019.1 bleomycin hydrolase [Balneicella halophila]